MRDYSELAKLCSIQAVATEEDKVKAYIREVVAPYADDLFEDTFGNLIVHKAGDGPKMMISAHTDQIGFMIHDIEGSGVLRFTPVGGLIPFTLIGQRVVIKDQVVGAIGVDIDLEAGGDLGKAGTKQMYIDIGVTSKEAAEALVEIGDFGTFAGDFYENDQIVMSKALDDRVGCFALCQLVKTLDCPAYDLYLAFTSQEETGTRGAYTAAYTVEPEYGIAIDITPAGDLPGTKNSTAALGKGVGIKLMDPMLIIHPELKAKFKATLADHGIDHQYEVMKRGGTDAGAFQSVKAGVKSAAVSLTTRNAHTANEVISKKDIDSLIDFLVSVVSK